MVREGVCVKFLRGRKRLVYDMKRILQKKKRKTEKKKDGS